MRNDGLFKHLSATHGYVQTVTISDLIFLHYVMMNLSLVHLEVISMRSKCFKAVVFDPFHIKVHYLFGI